MVFQFLLKNLMFKNLHNYNPLIINIRLLSVLQKSKSQTNGKNSMVYSNRIELTKKIILSQSPLIKSENEQEHKSNDAKVGRPLALIYGWMSSKDKQLEKYRQLWLKMGFDVLTVRYTPFEVFVPSFGSTLLAKNLVNILSDLSPHYNEVVVHSFSGGGILFGETLRQIRAQEQYMRILDRIKGVIIDSINYPEDIAEGLSIVLTNKPVIRSLMRNSLDAYYKLTYPLTLKYFERAIQEIIEPAQKYPGLLLYSKNDIISNDKKNEQLIQKWNQLGNGMRFKCWEDSIHVKHYVYHQKEYEQELDYFIRSLQLKALG